MRTAYTISAIGHATVLLWSVWSLGAKPLPFVPSEMVPVDVVSVSDLTQTTAGSKDAPKAEAPKPLVEKVAEAKPIEDQAAKLVEKKEVHAAHDTAPPPEAKPPETKPEQKQPEVKPEPVAEALAKQDTKRPEPKKAEVKPPAPPKKPTAPAPKFDPKQVAALLDKREATRLAATGDALQSTPTLGASTGQAAQMSQSELDALRQRLAQLWNPPAGARDPRELVVVFRIQLTRDGRIAPGPWPQLVSSGGSNTPIAMAARESAARALNRGQPYDMLKPEHYEQWKDIEITFDPREMFGSR
jgi:outer membrane biosynthesis protein TonB